MENNNMTESKKGFLQNDRRLVCSMLAFYGICIIGMIAVTFWGLDRSKQTASANATATAAINATQQANATSTAIVHATELAQYEFIEHFDKAPSKWRIQTIKNDYWEGSIEIKDGVYAWEVDEVKKTFVQREDFFYETAIKDFDVYVDMKFAEGMHGDVCAGLVFRRSFKGWNHGVYIFTICNNSTFNVYYHGENGWENMSKSVFSSAIENSDWNRIEISAQSDDFIFSINNMLVYELTDDRQPTGALGVIIEIREKNPAKIWFDNFGFQNR